MSEGARLAEFRQEVLSEFGPRLDRMTPENVRDFLSRVYARERRGEPGGRYSISEPSGTPESIMRDFLGRTLEAPAEEAVVHLWVLVLEMLMTSFWELDEARLVRLLGADETPSDAA